MPVPVLTIKRRRSFNFQCTVYDVYVKENDPGNVVQNLTGWTLKAQVREKKINSRQREGKLVANLNPVAAVPSNGRITITHDRDFTTALADRPSSEIEWDLIGTDVDGRDWDIVPAEPIAIATPPTDPDDVSDPDFVPGGGGAVYHTHPISQVVGLQAALDALAALSVASPPVEITGPAVHNVIDGEYFFIIDAAAGDAEIVLPTPAARIGKPPMVFKRIDSSGVNLVEYTGTIDGITSMTQDNQNSCFTVRASASGFLITTGYLLV